MAGESSLTRPPSSLCETSGRVCAIHGNDASIVAGVSRTPGRISRANARVGGNAALSEANAVLAFSSVGASRRIVACRLSDSEAKAAVVRLKFVIRSLSCSSWRISAALVRAVPSIRRERSFPGSWPRKASKTWAVERSAAGMST